MHNIHIYIHIIYIYTHNIYTYTYTDLSRIYIFYFFFTNWDARPIQEMNHNTIWIPFHRPVFHEINISQPIVLTPTLTNMDKYQHIFINIPMIYISVFYQIFPYFPTLEVWIKCKKRPPILTQINQNQSALRWTW